MNKKLIATTTGALLAATTAFGAGAPAAFAQEGDGNGVGSGNAVKIDLDIPVVLCGLGVAVAGDAYGQCAVSSGAAQAEGTRQAGIRETADDPTATATGTPAPTPAPTGNGHGIGSGNAVQVNGNVPVALCGPAPAVAGDADSYCEPGAVPPAAGGTGAAPSGNGHGVLSGNAAAVDLNIPVWACALGVAIFGDAWGDCSAG